MDTIKQQYGDDGDCYVGDGEHTCTMLTCVGEAAIWLCNTDGKA